MKYKETPVNSLAPKQNDGLFTDFQTCFLQCISMTSHECHWVSNRRPLKCLSNSLFGLTTSKKHQRLALLTFCEGNPPVTRGVPHPHKGPVMWKGFSLYHDFMMENIYIFIMISFGACSCLRLNYLSIP